MKINIIVSTPNKISVNFHVNNSSGSPHAVTPNTRIVKMRGYGDPIMIARDGLDVALTGDNFNHCDYWASEGVNASGVHLPNWGAVSKFQPLGKVELDYLKSIQPNDFSVYGFTLAQKMNWLVGECCPPARPYWTIGGKWSGTWSKFHFGTMVFGHQPVRVKTNPDGSLKVTKFLTQYKDYDRWLTGEVEFLEVDGFRPEMMSWSVDWLVQNAYIQSATEAYKTNIINDLPRGRLYHPVWSPDYYPSNYGKLYLPRFAIVE